LTVLLLYVHIHYYIDRLRISMTTFNNAVQHH